jgi:hypothetical protein
MNPTELAANFTVDYRRRAAKIAAVRAQREWLTPAYVGHHRALMPVRWTLTDPSTTSPRG